MIYFINYFSKIIKKYQSSGFSWLFNSFHKLDSLIFQVLHNCIQYEFIKFFMNFFGKFCILRDFPSLFNGICKNIFKYFSFQVILILKIRAFTDCTLNSVRIDKSAQILNFKSNLIFLSFYDFSQFFTLSYFFQKLFVFLF